MTTKNTTESVSKQACQRYSNDSTRLIDILRDVQAQSGCVSSEAINCIARQTGLPRVEVESAVTFYAFLSREPKGKIIIRLCNDVVDMMNGMDKVAATFSEELGIKPGETTSDGRITLEWTPCIGMSDQAPAALINETVITRLTPDKVREVVAALKQGAKPGELVRTHGDGNNDHPLIRAMISNNIRRKGPVIFSDFESGSAIRNAVAMTPAEVIRNVKTSRLRGRGGAGFPTGMKWEFTRQAQGTTHYVLCNGDEGEPGTFKDRVVLTECPDLMFEGMTIAGYAVGAATGILYLRGEYAYLRNFLEEILKKRRKNGLLGADIGGAKGFNFDIRIQMGAGAYICGEETSLISSCEGLRGDPKTRPPFPAQKGYLGCPTTVNNIETFCCVARILDKGPGWFAQMGSKGSPGTKLISVSGDCRSPGVYEIPFGMKLGEFLKTAGAEDAYAVQMGGPSGHMVGKAAFDRIICYDDLSTGGSVMVFGKQRNILQIVDTFLEFFVDESCGYCTPCRVGNQVMRERIRKLLNGNGEPQDLDYLRKLAESIKFMSRCGLGQTSPNTVLSTMKNFPEVYESVVSKDKDGLQRSFNLDKALVDAIAIAGRPSAHLESII